MTKTTSNLGLPLTPVGPVETQQSFDSAMQRLDKGGSGVKTITAGRALNEDDKNVYLRVNSATGQNITIPPGLYSIGQQTVLRQAGDGAITLVEGDGVTLNVRDGKDPISAGKGAVLTIICVGENEFDAVGELEDAA